MAKPKPIKAHITALLAASSLLAIALGFSWCLPVTFLTLTRTGSTTVDCHIDQRLLGVISFKTVLVSDVREVRLREELGAGREGKRRKGKYGKGDPDYYIDLIDASGQVTSVESNVGEPEVVARIADFLTDSSKTSLKEWTVYAWGLVAAVPAVLGLLFIALVLWDMCASLWARATSWPDDSGENTGG